MRDGDGEHSLMEKEKLSLISNRSLQTEIQTKKMNNQNETENEISPESLRIGLKA